jgi:hypothetical protein
MGLRSGPSADRAAVTPISGMTPAMVVAVSHASRSYPAAALVTVPHWAGIDSGTRTGLSV